MICWLGITTGLAGQHPHQRIPLDDVRHRIDATTYGVEADISADSAQIRARIDITFVNNGEQPVDSLILLLPADSIGQLSFDSISYRGVPLDPTQVRRESQRVMLPLPDQLPPGQSALIFISCLLQLSAPIADEPAMLESWLPWLRVPGDDSSKIRLSFTISCDSSLRVLTAGALINDNEHYGMLPMTDGLHSDVTDSMLAADLQTQYRPQFDRGRRVYLFRTPPIAEAPLILSPPFRYDRVVKGKLTLDVFYGPSVPRARADSLSRLLHEYVQNKDFNINSSGERITAFVAEGVASGTYHRLLVIEPSSISPASRDSLLHSVFEKIGR